MLGMLLGVLSILPMSSPEWPLQPAAPGRYGRQNEIQWEWVNELVCLCDKSEHYLESTGHHRHSTNWHAKQCLKLTFSQLNLSVGMFLVLMLTVTAVVVLLLLVLLLQLSSPVQKLATHPKCIFFVRCGFSFCVLPRELKSDRAYRKTLLLCIQVGCTKSAAAVFFFLVYRFFGFAAPSSKNGNQRERVHFPTVECGKLCGQSRDGEEQCGSITRKHTRNQ